MTRYTNRLYFAGGETLNVGSFESKADALAYALSPTGLEQLSLIDYEWLSVEPLGSKPMIVVT